MLERVDVFAGRSVLAWVPDVCVQRARICCTAVGNDYRRE